MFLQRAVGRQQIEFDHALAFDAQAGNVGLDFHGAAGRDDLLGKVQIAQAEVARLRHAHVDQIERDAGEFVQAVLEPGGLIGPPRRPRQVGKDIDFLGRQVAFLQHHRGLADDLAERPRVGDEFQPLDPLLAQAAIGVEAPRRHARIEDRDLAFRRQLGQEPLADFLGRFQAGLLFVAILHVRGGVEDQRRRHGRLLAAQPRRELDARPRQGQGQQGDRPRAEQQQQQVPQAQPPLVGVMPFLDEPQGREFQQLRPLAHDQVQDDRNHDQPRAGQEVRG